MTLGMSPTRFDLMVNGREKFSSIVYSSSLSYQANVNKMRSRIVEQVFNNRKYFYRNRVEFYQYQSMVTGLEKSHRHQRRKQIDTRQKVVEDLKQIRSIRYPSSLTSKLFKTKDFYRFGIRTAPPVLTSSKKATVDSQNSIDKLKINDRPKTAPLMTVNQSKSEEKANINQSVQETLKDITADPTDLRREMALSDESSPSRPIRYRIQMKTFALEDESQRNDRYFLLMMEKRKAAAINRNIQKEIIDTSVEDTKEKSVEPSPAPRSPSPPPKARVKSYLPDDLIEEHRKNDRIFAEHYRQFQISKRFHQVPKYNLDHHQHLSIAFVQQEQKLLKRKIEEQRMKLGTPKISFINQHVVAQRMKNVLQALQDFKDI